MRHRRRHAQEGIASPLFLLAAGVLAAAGIGSYFALRRSAHPEPTTAARATTVPTAPAAPTGTPASPDRQSTATAGPRGATPDAAAASPGPTAAAPATPTGAAAPNTGSPSFSIIYQTDFGREIDRGLMLQEPTAASLTLANAPCAPSAQVLRVSIRQQDDYSRVANGVPRAEISFAGRFTFEAGREYMVAWSTCLPADFPFDWKQPEGIGQIHEGVPKGSPPWGMTLVGDRYHVQVRDGSQTQDHDIGSAAGDRGRWVRWALRYRADASGAGAITELTRDGAVALSADGVPNAYPGDSQAYFKIGIYKWWWQERPSDVSALTMFFGDVVVRAK